jgi:hypothetical protein
MEFNIVGLDKSEKDTFDEVMNNNQMSLLGREAIYSYFGDGKKYLEWGSGGSTLWYIDEVIKNKVNTQIISVEHHADWYNKVKSAVDNHLAPSEEQFLYLHKEAPWSSITFNSPQGNIPFNVVSTPFEEVTAGLAEYINPPEIDLSDIDVFLVDGLGRGGCLATIKASIKKDAVVFLHDIDGRESWYQWALDLWLKDYSIEYVYHNLIKLVPND